MFWKMVLLALFCFQLWAGDGDVYKFKWLDPDKQVFVLQNREYRKVDRFYLALSLGMTTSNEFISGTALQGRLGYFFRENWGVQFLYSANSGEEKDSAKAIIAQGTVPFYRKVTNYVGGAVQWAPFYSKINTFNKIVYMDWILGLGLVSVSDEDNGLRFSRFSNKNLQKESHIGLSWNISSVFYISKSWAARFDLSAIHYNANNYIGTGINSSQVKKELFSHYDISLGIQYIF